MSMNDRNADFDVMAQLPALRRYGLVLTRDPAEAEELVQEALLRAYEKRGSFRIGSPLRPWLLSILHNRFVDGMRKRRAEQKLLTATGHLADQHEEPVQEHQIRLAQLRQRFLSLPEDQRTALHLIAIEGLAYQEAASTLGIPVGTLMSRLGRARAALRALEAGDRAGEADAAAARAKAPRLRIVGGPDDSSE
jgi:RNA polymerase sigma-70 factor (ECF subfamily)